MGRAAADHKSTKTLLRYAKKGATGRVGVGSDENEVTAYLLGGELVAATSADDSQRLVLRLALEGLLSAQRASELEDLAEDGGSVLGILLNEVPHPDLDRVLLDQFMENVARFTGDPGRASFRSQPTVFVENIQMGFDTYKVIKQCAATWDSAQALDLDADLFVGRTKPQSPEQELICSMLADGPVRCGDIVRQIPLESTACRALVNHMLRINILRLWVPGMGEDPDTEAVELELDEPASEDEDFQEDVHDPEDLGPVPETAEIPEPDDPQDESFDQDTHPTLLGMSRSELMLGDEEESGPAEKPVPQAEDVTDQDSVNDLTAEERALLEQLQQREESQDEIEEGSEESTGAGNLSSLNAWLTAATDVEEDELDAFTDHDYDRGSIDQGAFSTSSHNLDKVEVATIDNPPEEEMLEADEAPVAKFSAPVLSEEEAVGKLEVANDVLLVVVEAFDAAEGHGRGRAVVQLLIDGSPARYTALFNDVPITETGELPEEEILNNLYSRPPSEHRRLFNQGLADLLERALSSAADELPDEAIDNVLERVVGYRQRLGL